MPSGNHQSSVTPFESTLYGNCNIESTDYIARPKPKRYDPRTHTKQHEIKFRGIWVRDDSCDFVDRFIPSKLYSKKCCQRNTSTERLPMFSTIKANPSEILREC